MAVTPSSFEPQKLTAGDTVSFVKALADFPAGDGWALTYEVSGPNGQYEFNSAASGNSHLCTVAAATTAGWLPGEYELSGFAVNATTAERVQIYQAQLHVLPNTAAGAAAQQTHAQKMITLIEGVMLGKAGHDILESDIEGTCIKRLSPAELWQEYNYWRGVRAQETRGGKAGKIVPRFQITGQASVPIGRRYPFQ
jgi:hypothetical protein